MLTSYIKVFEELCDHLNNNYLIALTPDPISMTEDIIEPILQIYNLQGSKLSNIDYDKLQWITYETLLKSALL